MYLHYFTNLLSSPTGNVLSSYSVGARLGEAGTTDVAWKVHDHESGVVVVKEILESIERLVIPWFDLINNVDEYLCQVRQKRSYLRIEEAQLLAITGKSDDAVKLCDAMKKSVQEDGLNDSDTLDEYIVIFDKLINAINNDSLREYIDDCIIINCNESKI